MLRHSDAILKLAAALALLIAGAGVGYYYGIYLPAQDVRRQAQEMAEREADAQRQSKALEERARQEQAAQAGYDSCIASAEAAYRQRWTNSCEAQHDADMAAYADCADDLFSTDAGCRAKFPVRPPVDCALPPETAQEYARAREDRKAQCVADLQDAQRRLH